MTRCPARYKFTDPTWTAECELPDRHYGEHQQTVPEGVGRIVWKWFGEPRACAEPDCRNLALLTPTYCHLHGPDRTEETT